MKLFHNLLFLTLLMVCLINLTHSETNDLLKKFIKLLHHGDKNGGKNGHGKKGGDKNGGRFENGFLGGGLGGGNYFGGPLGGGFGGVNRFNGPFGLGGRLNEGNFRGGNNFNGRGLLDSLFL